MGTRGFFRGGTAAGM